MCHMKRPKSGHDPCIANLPGVIYACCGHGVVEGYIAFENGVIVKGLFHDILHCRVDFEHGSPSFADTVKAFDLYEGRNITLRRKKSENPA